MDTMEIHLDRNQWKSVTLSRGSLVEKEIQALSDAKFGTYRGKSDKIPIEGPIPIDELIVLDGLLYGKKFRVLKDDECNSSFISQEVFMNNLKHFNWKKCRVVVSHSRKGSVENLSKAIVGATFTIGKHSHKSHWLVENC